MEHKVIPIKFSKLGKKYYFDTNGLEIKQGDHLVVETVRGLEMGLAAENPKMIDASELVSALKPVLRIATDKDIHDHEHNLAEQPEVMKRTGEMIRKNSLNMKLLNCEFTLDRQKLIIYFNADGRIDFRDLVKDLANLFRIRIELRQVGTRDGAKVLGGIGPCGLLTCCTTFLGDFETVSIKMAKNQNLSLNPTNISGLCGKLLCCINYEDANYKEYRKSMPKLDSLVNTPDGQGKVVQLNFLAQTVNVDFGGGNRKLYPVSDLEFKQKAVEDDLNGNDKDLKELEG